MGFSLVGGVGATLEVWGMGFSLWWLLVAEHGLNSCGTWAELTLQHVESSQTRGHLCCLHWQADCPPLDHHGIPHIGSLVTGVAESKLQTFLVILTDHNENAITIVIFPE